MKLLSIKINLLVIALFLLTEVGCEDLFNAPDYDYKVPETESDGLEVGTAVEAGMDTGYLVDAVKAIKKGKFNEIHSMLIFKDDKLVFEEYFEGHKYQWDAPKYHGEKVYWNWNMSHSMMSCTKSFMSACIGIAIDKGFIENVNQSIFDYLPNHQNLKTNNREYITIEHLLTMTSGLAWDEWSTSHGGDFTNDIDALWFAKNQVSTVLEREWRAVPGTFFTYNGGGMVILGEILKNATGMNVDEFSKKYLLSSLKPPPLVVVMFKWLCI